MNFYAKLSWVWIWFFIYFLGWSLIEDTKYINHNKVVFIQNIYLFRFCTLTENRTSVFLCMFLLRGDHQDHHQCCFFRPLFIHNLSVYFQWCQLLLSLLDKNYERFHSLRSSSQFLVNSVSQLLIPSRIYIRRWVSIKQINHTFLKFCGCFYTEAVIFLSQYLSTTDAFSVY